MRAIRARKLLVIAVTLTVLAASGAWLYLSPPSYETTAEVLVSPLSQDDPNLLGLPVIRDTPGEPTRAVQTAATLIESSAAARTTAETLGPGWTANRVLSAVDVEPQGQSNILAISATADDAGLAARIANEFTGAALQARSEGIERRVATELDRLTGQQEGLGTTNPELAATVATRITQLEAIREQGDPTLSLTEEATRPTAVSGAPAPLVLVLAVLAGLALGAVAAVLRELTDRTIRDEAEALTLFPLPVLARVPHVARRARRSSGDAVWHMPPAVREAFRSVLAQIGEQPGAGRALMVTSASTGDGKTTSAINLAVSIAASGRSAVLLDFDLRKPDVGAKLGLSKGESLLGLMDAATPVSDLLRPVPQVPSLSVLSAGTQAADAALVEVLHSRLPELVAQARQLADYVIIDTAPLGEVSDALRIVHGTDETLIVLRPGESDRMSFETMRDLLQRSGRAPLGIVLIGAETPAMSSGYYGYGASQRELFRRPESVR